MLATQPQVATPSKDLGGKRGSGLAALYHKELGDHLNSRRYNGICALFFIIASASLGAAVSELSGQTFSTNDFIFMSLYSTGSSTIYSFATFMAFLGPLIGVMLGFDAVQGECAQRTLIRLAAQPIYRDSIINAKFLAGVTAIFMLVFGLGCYIGGVGLILIGIPPTGEELIRIFLFLLLTCVYISLWLALSMICSTVCKHSATAALYSLAVWLFVCFFMSLVASAITTAIYPLDGIQGFLNMTDNYNLTVTLNRFSPYYLFSEIQTTILNPSVRSTGIVTQAQVDGVLEGYLSVGQSTLLVLPNIIAMIAATMALFAAGYINFLKQEIRG